MGSKKETCIICGKERGGLPVKNDHVISALRWIKRNITKNAKGNTLVVCRECYEKYSKSRRKYVSRRNIYLILGAMLAVLLVVAARSALSVAWGIILILFMYALSLLTYMPGLDVKKA